MARMTHEQAAQNLGVSLRPSITLVVSRYVALKRAGRELRGLCPLHAEKTPSFTVNEEKGVFHCFGCQEGGDVITFIQKVEGMNFKEAFAYLGLPGAARCPKPRKFPERIAAEILTKWVEQMSSLIGARMRELGQREHTVKSASDVPGVDVTLLHQERERLGRHWTILDTLDADLHNPQILPELWEQRASVEGIVNGN